MREETFKRLIKEALGEYLETDEGRVAMGRAAYDAVRAALTAEVRMVDGKSEPGRRIEKTEVVNLVEFLARYLPGLEGAIRGCQSDAAQARNRAVESLAAVERVVGALVELSRTTEDFGPTVTWWGRHSSLEIGQGPVQPALVNLEK